MTAIFRRELHGSYLASPIGYVYLAVFTFFAGFYFYAYNLVPDRIDMSNLFASLFNICIFTIPMLTMRLLSEERRNKTDQLLLTSPISLGALMTGKYFAALAVFCMGLLPLVIFALTMQLFVTPDWAVFTGHLLGMVLLGGALIAINMFISTLTENQIVAATGGFTVGFLLIRLDGLASTVQNPLLGKALDMLSFNSHYLSFAHGRLSLTDVVFFVTVCTVFVFMSVQVFERRRWS